MTPLTRSGLVVLFLAVLTSAEWLKLLRNNRTKNSDAVLPAVFITWLVWLIQP